MSSLDPDACTTFILQIILVDVTRPKRRNKRKPSNSGSSSDSGQPLGQNERFRLDLCLVLSGASALIYENVWNRQLSTVFSGTAVTSCLIFASFMGGMAIGSWIAGRLCETSRHPLRIFIGVELGLGLAGLTYPAFLRAIGNVYVSMFVESWGPSVQLLIRFLLFSLVLLAPAILMGASLPLMIRTTVRHRKETGRALSWFYAVNSFGGVVGCLLAGFCLIEAVGLAASSHLGALGNITAALLAFTLERHRTGADSRGSNPSHVEPALDPPEPEPARTLSMPRVRSILFVSGFTAMALEVLWSRTLPLVLGSSTYSFALIVATFITGVTLGSLFYPRALRITGSAVTLLKLCQFAIGIWILVTIPLYVWLPTAFVWVRTTLGPDFTTFQLTALAVNAGVMIVPATLFGLGLPAGIGSLGPDGLSPTRSVGTLYAVNTVGNVIGSLITGLVMIPTIGAAVSFQVVATMNLLAGLAAVDGPWTGKRFLATGVFAGCFACAIVPAWSRNWMPYLASHAPSRIRRLTWEDAGRKVNQVRDVIFFDEDRTTTVAVTRGERQVSLWVNGKVDATSSGDMETQIMLAHFPMLLHPAPRNVFILGLGSGVTAGTVLRYPVDRVLCCEISSAVSRAARLFDDVNKNPFADPRFTCVIDDARHYIKTRNETFDTIILEPSNPWVTGITNLFTREFLTECAQKLDSQGLMVEWIPMYEMSHEDFRTIIRTFLSVFPHLRAFHTSGDLILVGSRSASSLAAGGIGGRLRARLELDGVRESLKDNGFEHAATFLANEYFDGVSAKRFAGEGPLLTDDLPVLEFTAPRAFYTGLQIELDYQLLPNDRSLLAGFMSGRKATDEEWIELGRYRTRRKLYRDLGTLLRDVNTEGNAELAHLSAVALAQIDQFDEAIVQARFAATKAPDSVEYVRTWFLIASRIEGRVGDTQKIDTPSETRAALNALLELEIRNPGMVDLPDLILKGRGLRPLNDRPAGPSRELPATPELRDEKIRLLQTILAKDDRVPLVHSLLAELYLANKRTQESLDHLTRAVELDSRRSADWSHLGILIAELGGPPKPSEVAFRDALSADPDHLAIRNELGLCLLRQKKSNEAVETLLTCVDSQKPHPQILLNLARALEQAGRLEDARKRYTQFLEIAPEDDPLRVSVQTQLNAP